MGGDAYTTDGLETVATFMQLPIHAITILERFRSFCEADFVVFDPFRTELAMGGARSFLLCENVLDALLAGWFTCLSRYNLDCEQIV